MPNAVSEELKNLQEPLHEYNTLFTRLQSRVRMTPLIGERYISEDTNTATATGSLLASPSLPPAPSPPPKSPLNTAPSGPAQDHTLNDDDASSGTDTPDESDADTDIDDEDSQERWFSLDTAEDVSLDMDLIEDEDGEWDEPDGE